LTQRKGSAKKDGPHQSLDAGTDQKDFDSSLAKRKNGQEETTRRLAMTKLAGRFCKAL